MLEKCIQAGLRMTNQRASIVKVLEQSIDHPDADILYRRAHEIDPTISLATIYRTLGIFEKAGLVQKVDVGDGKAHCEVSRQDHEHLVDIEFLEKNTVTCRVGVFRSRYISLFAENHHVNCFRNRFWLIHPPTN